MTGWVLRRLREADAEAFHAFRREGIAREPRAFRIAPEDEEALTPAQVAARLEEAHVVGRFDAAGLAGVGGLSRYDGAKLRHRALLWGMYVAPRARGTGLGDAIVAALLDAARAQGIAQVLLTVVASNPPAVRLYERWGFVRYGLEPRAIRLADGETLDEALMIRRLAPDEGSA